MEARVLMGLHVRVEIASPGIVANVPQQVARPPVQVESSASAPTVYKHMYVTQGRAMEVLVSLLTHVLVGTV